jgi:hypothetical protein
MKQAAARAQNNTIIPDRNHNSGKKETVVNFLQLTAVRFPNNIARYRPGNQAVNLPVA